MNVVERRGDAVVIGSGPNGLAAAITLAEAGVHVKVYEAADTIGGGTRTAELTLPGFRHDICSTVQAMGMISPFFRALPLDQYGLEWVYPTVPLAHPLDDGSVVSLFPSLDKTAQQFDGPDATAYRNLIAPLLTDADKLWPMLLGPAPIPPRHPIALAKLGLRALWPATTLANARFRDEPAKALLAGNAAHSVISLREPGSSAIAIMLMLSAHIGGWPFAKGGSEALCDAMAAYLTDLGGEIVTNTEIQQLDSVPTGVAVLFDTTPRQALAIAGDRWPERYRRQLGRFRYGAGAFKVDWALDGPIPWTNSDTAKAGTVHLGGTLAEIAESEALIAAGKHPERPYVLLAQPTLFDSTRAPEGKHIAWAYCHLPNGSTKDMLGRIEAQIERFAPGFGDTILARNVMAPADLERYNANYAGGDFNGGRQDLRQQFTRPVPSLNPYATPDPSLFFCSSSTPPGGGVHGMCGFHAAQAVLRKMG